MKKFSKLNESKQSVDKSTNRNDFITNLINETLSVKNNEIIGKDVLAKTLNKILDINESKLTIKVLENVKAASFHSFNLNWINESIEKEKKKLVLENNNSEIKPKQKDLFEYYEEQPEELRAIINKYTDENYDYGDSYEYSELEEMLREVEAIGYTFEYGLDAIPYALRKIGVKVSELEGYEDYDDDECDDCNEGKINEAKIEIEIDVKVKPEEGEKIDVEFDNDIEGDKIVHFDEFEEPEVEEIEEETMFVKESTYNQYNELYNLMKTIGKINEEHHLDDKDERINFILSNLGNKKVEKFVISKISDLPDYVKSADIEKTLRNLSDKEVEELYLSVEDAIGIKESKVELIKEEHHLNTKKDRIDFILANTKNDMVNSYVLNYVKNHPEYLRSGDVEKTLKKLNEDEVEEIYLSIEKIIGVK